MRLLAGWKRISPGHSKAVWSAGPVCSAVSPLCHYTMTFALYSCLHLLAQTCTGPYRKQTLLTINPSADVTSFNIINQTSFNLQVVVVITVPLSYRICECLVPYFDSRSSGSCNVSLLSGCVFFFFFYFTHSICHDCFLAPPSNTAWKLLSYSLLICSMTQDVDFSCPTPQ